MIRAIEASTVARWWASKNRPLMVAPRSLLARLADRDRDDDDGAAGDELLAELEPHQDEAVVDQADHQRADDRAHDGAHAAEQAGAAEHGRRDDRELVALAELDAAGLEAAGVEHPRDGRGHGRDQEDAQLDPARVDAAVTRRRLAAAGRQHPAAEAGAAEDEVPDHAEQERPGQERGHRPDLAAAEGRARARG